MKELLTRWMPDPQTLRQHKHLRCFARWLDHPGLWHLNRRSAAGAIAVGLFMAWIPVPFQMMLAAGAAILWRVNLPISVATVWLTNPLTMPALFYMAYYVGRQLLGLPAVEFDPILSWEWLSSVMETIGKPFLLGCAVLAVCSSATGYLLIQAGWRYSVCRRYRQRAERR